MLLQNSAFLSQLELLFSKSKEKGTVYITMKRFAHKQAHTEDTEYACLLRATFGKSKISTRIEPQDWERFNTDYMNICRMHMDSLKKKERKKKNKDP
jgi:signal recognition particle subunit SRP14